MKKYETRCLTCGSEVSRDWLHTMKGVFHPCVHGAVQDAINKHGVINQTNISSVTKRIVGAILTKLYEVDSGIARTKMSIRKLPQGQESQD